MLSYLTAFALYFVVSLFWVSLFVLPCALGAVIAIVRRRNWRASFRHGFAATASGLAGFPFATVGMTGSSSFSPNNMGNIAFLAAFVSAMGGYVAAYLMALVMSRIQRNKSRQAVPTPGQKVLISASMCIALTGFGWSARHVAPGVDAQLASQSNDPEVLGQIAAAGPPQTLGDVYIAASLAGNSSTPTQTLKKLAGHAHEPVRWTTANRKQLHPEVVSILARDCSNRIRQLVMEGYGVIRSPSHAPYEDDCGAQSL